MILKHRFNPFRATGKVPEWAVSIQAGHHPISTTFTSIFDHYWVLFPILMIHLVGHLDLHFTSISSIQFAPENENQHVLVCKYSIFQQFQPIQGIPQQFTFSMNFATL